MKEGKEGEDRGRLREEGEEEGSRGGRGKRRKGMSMRGCHLTSRGSWEGAGRETGPVFIFMPDLSPVLPDPLSILAHSDDAEGGGGGKGAASFAVTLK